MGKWYGKWLKFKHSMSIRFNSSTLHPGCLPSVWAVYIGFRDETTMDFPRNQRRVSVFEIGEPQLQWIFGWNTSVGCHRFHGYVAYVCIYKKMSTYDIRINTCIYLDIPDEAHQLIEYRWNLTVQSKRSVFPRVGACLSIQKNLLWNTVGDSFVLLISGIPQTVIDGFHDAMHLETQRLVEVPLSNMGTTHRSHVFSGKYISTQRKNTPFHTNTPAQALFFRSVLNGWLFKVFKSKGATNIPCFWQHQVEKRNQTRTTSQGNCTDSKWNLYISTCPIKHLYFKGVRVEGWILTPTWNS